MDPEKANAAADALLSIERDRSKSLMRAGYSARNFMDRLLVGVFTLGGSYVGSRFFSENPELGVPPFVAGIVLGLVVAVMFPARKT